MLTAEQIEALGIKAQTLLDPIQSFLIRELASRIKEAGGMTATAEYQVWRLQNMGKSQAEIKREVAKLLKISVKKLEKLMLEAGEDGYTYDLSSLPQAEGIPFAEDAAMQRIISAAASQAQEDLENITQTLGFCLDREGKVCLPLTQAYEKACDTAFMRVSTGAQDFQSAVREATKGLASRGIQYIDYESGIHTSLEAATRRSVMGSMGLMQERISQQVHEEYGCNGWEISAHSCSAPDHEPIQGKQYSDAEYQALNGSLRRRIGTLNCGHAAHPIIMGISRQQYSEKELQKLRQENESGVEIDGKKYTLYETTQRQRAIERAMRKQKKKILVAEAIGDPDLPQLQSRYRVLSQEYSRFSDRAGLRTQVERTRVALNETTQNKLFEKTYAGGIGDPKTDLDYISSDEYKSKFSSISDNTKLNRAIYERCKAAVTHQSGKFTEDLSIIDLQGNLIGETSSKIAYETQYSQSLKRLVLSAEPYSLISIHDHGTNVPPSGADFASAGSKKYAFGVVACHDGRVYWYSSANARPFLPSLIDDKVDKYRNPPYNKTIQEAFEYALNDAVKAYGIEWRELK